MAEEFDFQSKYSGEEVEHILDNAMLRNELDLSGYAKKEDIPPVPTKISELDNDSGFISSSDVDKKISEAISYIPQPDLSGYVTDEELEERLKNLPQGGVSEERVQEIVDEAIENIDIPESDYQSSIEDKELTMPNAVGGLSAGTKVSDLEGKTYSEMFDEILFPTIYPTYVAPSATIKFNGYASVQEVGSVAPAASDFTTSFSRGAINLGGVKQADRAGALTSGEVFCTGGSMPTSVPLGDTQYKYRANYAQGAQPKDNKGNNYGSPLPGGSVESSAVTLNGTYPWYIRGTKQALVSWSANMSTGQFTLEATGVAEQMFKLPRALKELQMLNTISGKFETVTLDSWTETTETMNNTTYYAYTYNGAARGEVTLIATF